MEPKGGLDGYKKRQYIPRIMVKLVLTRFGESADIDTMKKTPVSTSWISKDNELTDFIENELEPLFAPFSGQKRRRLLTPTEILTEGTRKIKSLEERKVINKEESDQLVNLLIQAFIRKVITSSLKPIIPFEKSWI